MAQRYSICMPATFACGARATRARHIKAYEQPHHTARMRARGVAYVACAASRALMHCRCITACPSSPHLSSRHLLRLPPAHLPWHATPATLAAAAALTCLHTPTSALSLNDLSRIWFHTTHRLDVWWFTRSIVWTIAAGGVDGLTGPYTVGIFLHAALPRSFSTKRDGGLYELRPIQVPCGTRHLLRARSSICATTPPLLHCAHFIAAPHAAAKRTHCALHCCYRAQRSAQRRSKHRAASCAHTHAHPRLAGKLYWHTTRRRYCAAACLRISGTHAQRRKSHSRAFTVAGVALRLARRPARTPYSSPL